MPTLSDLLTVEAIQRWKLRYIGRHKDQLEEHSRAVNTINAHVSNERVADQSPMHEVARMVDGHAGKAFKGVVGEIIVIPARHDGRNGMEAGEDGGSESGPYDTAVR